MRRHHLMAFVLGALAVEMALFGAISASAAPAHRAASPSACREPWSVCSPDAQWLRQVLARAGYRHNVSANGAALIVPFSDDAQNLERFFWATRGAHLASPYRLLYRVAQTPVFGDGTRIVWRTQGARVWVEPAPTRKALVKIIAASKSLPRR